MACRCSGCRRRRARRRHRGAVDDPGRLVLASSTHLCRGRGGGLIPRNARRRASLGAHRADTHAKLRSSLLCSGWNSDRRAEHDRSRSTQRCGICCARMRPHVRRPSTRAADLVGSGGPDAALPLRTRRHGSGICAELGLYPSAEDHMPCRPYVARRRAIALQGISIAVLCSDQALDNAERFAKGPQKPSATVLQTPGCGGWEQPLPRSPCSRNRIPGGADRAGCLTADG